MTLTDDERAACKTALAKFIADCKAQTGVVNPVTLYSDAMFAAGITYAQKWRLISTAPKDGTVVLAIIAGYDFAVSARWHIKHGNWYTGVRWSRARNYTPTHWMPLPAAPGSADGESNE